MLIINRDRIEWAAADDPLATAEEVMELCEALDWIGHYATDNGAKSTANRALRHFEKFILKTLPRKSAGGSA